jgi:serine/threonine-protein kinase
MGRVHEAWDPLLRRKVALKLLHRGDPVQLLRFMREAQIQARVEHPQICKVFEVGSEGDQPYIAMQFISGKTLGEAREELDLRNTARIMAEVAGAIHGAHRQGLVHRDLKPSNILLEPQEDGSLKPFVLDFGLAKDQSVADQTLSWGFVGTPAFMSPEQARGDDPSAASDVYGLGATFYACCSGHPPYEATTLVGLAAQQTEHLVLPLRRTDPKFPKDLDTILLK